MGLNWDINDVRRHAEKNAELYAERGIKPPAPRRVVVIQKDESDLPPDPYPCFTKSIVAAKCLRPVREYAFAKEYGRGWKFDYCWPLHKLAVEVDGAVHRIRERWEVDLDKFNCAELLGWTVLHLRPRHVEDLDGGAGAQIVIRYLQHGPASALALYRKVIR